MDGIEIYEPDARPPRLMEALCGVWRTSVTATHDFLGKTDIDALQPEVEKALAGIPRLAVALREGTPVGFVGAEGDIVEMLFLQPDTRGTGLGRLLLAHAEEEWETRRLDVNEDNRGAVGFYMHMGYTQVARSETDPYGNPFPILHMAKGNRAGE